MMFTSLMITVSVNPPFPSAPPANSQYFTRKSTPYFSSEVLIYQPNTIQNSVSELQLLSVNSSNDPDLYKGSFIRFLNGPNSNGVSNIVKSYTISESPGEPLSSSFQQPTVDIVEEVILQKLIGSSPNLEFGWSVAVSDDGSTIVSGEINLNNGDGAVYIYRNGSIISQQFITPDLIGGNLDIVFVFLLMGKLLFVVQRADDTYMVH